MLMMFYVTLFLCENNIFLQYFFYTFIMQKVSDIGQKLDEYDLEHFFLQIINQFPVIWDSIIVDW